MTGFSYKNVLVVGMARSGIAAAKLLVQKKVKVTVTDTKTSQQLGLAVEELETLGIRLILGGNPSVKGYDLVVVSPGVPLNIPTLTEAREFDIPIISEIELAYMFAKAPIIAITGTNGKTTTTSMIGELMKQNGTKTAVVGNIGSPLISAVEEYGQQDGLVVESSSFQLETIKTFKPKIAVILNVTPDHLDRHGSVEAYTLAKEKIFANQTADDFLVLNYDDPVVRAMDKKAKSKVIFFSTQHRLESGIFAQNDKVYWTPKGEVEELCDRADINIPGPHNLENALAVGATALALGINSNVLVKTYRSFEGVSHRLEYVAQVDGVTYVNDSKGTNPDAAIKALNSYDNPIVLIAGGKSKGSDFTEFAEAMVGRVKALVILGQTAEQIKESANKVGIHPIVHTETFEEATIKASQLAEPGDIVLLSPACASWDMFNSYEERGDLFKGIVSSLRR